MAIKHDVYLLLGSNIASRIDYLNTAKRLIGEELGYIQTTSSIYESESWGFEADMAFLNQVVLLRTNLEASALLRETQQIEKQLGRIKKVEGVYSSRTIDIDILFYDQIVLSIPGLEIPHKQIQNRRFTLLPLVEIAAELQHPALQKSCSQLLEECGDAGKVWKPKSAQLHEV